jgi:hypothetical protein
METVSMSEQYQLELIRSYASSGFAAVIAINSGALIAGLSQAGDLLDVFPPAAIALAVFIWAIGVTTGVATWGAAYRAVVALASSDQRERMRWRGVALDFSTYPCSCSRSASRLSACRSPPEGASEETSAFAGSDQRTLIYTASN